MSSFSVSNNGASSSNYSNDSAFYFIGQGLFTGNPDWTSILNGYTPGASGTFTSNWIVSGTGGSGKILSITLNNNENEFNNKTVFVILKTDGGTFMSGAGNIFSPSSTGGAAVACFAEGTRVLTQNGYKEVENLLYSDFIITSDNRKIDFNLLKTSIPSTTSKTAPYLIQKDAFGDGVPSRSIRLSPTHKMQIRPGIWISAEKASLTNPNVTQCEIGKAITYFHIECENYLQDNIVSEGITVESYGTLKSTGGRLDIYTWDDVMCGLKRE